MIINIADLGNIVANPKDFKTGSKGFYGSGKVTSKSGKRYQVNCQIVEIGSKPKPA